MKNQTKWILGIALGIIIIAIGFSGPSKKEVSNTTETIKVGLSAPMTGEAASYGDALFGGVHLAISEINAAGGINGRMMELIVADDKCSKDGASTFNKLVHADKVDVIIGPVCSVAASPGIPIAQAAGVPTIIHATAAGLPREGKYIFRDNPSDAFQGKFAAEYVKNELKKNKVAVLYTKNLWGEGIRDVFINQFKSLGGEIVYEESVSQESTDVRSQITKMKATKPELVYMPMYAKSGGAALKQMIELGLDVPILAGDTFDGEEIWNLSESEGVLYTTANVNNPQEFQDKVKLISGKIPNTFTPYAYDAVNIFAEAIEKVGDNGEDIAKYIAKTTFNAVSGPTVSFDKDGELTSAVFDVKKIQNKKGVILE